MRQIEDIALSDHQAIALIEAIRKNSGYGARILARTGTQIWRREHRCGGGFICYHIQIGAKRHVCDCLVESGRYTATERSVEGVLEQLARADIVEGAVA